MLLDDLVACIEVLQERIQSHGSGLRANEWRTRVALIDPLLHELGWDVSDPGLVTPEYEASGGRADYALLGTDGNPAAILEAKKLGEPLANHQMQMLNYVSRSGIVAYAGLTDGDHWELYTIFQQAQLEDRRILDVSIAKGPAHEVALKLLLLWRPNWASGRQPTPAGEPILGGAPDTGIKQAVVREAAPPGPTEPGWVALSEYNPPTKTRKPTSIRFWDGSQRSLDSWGDLFGSVAEKLHAERRFTADDMPIASGHKRYSVHTEPVHPTGRTFESYRRIEGTPPLYANVHMSASQVRDSARRLLRDHGVDPADVHLKVAQ